MNLNVVSAAYFLLAPSEAHIVVPSNFDREQRSASELASQGGSHNCIMRAAVLRCGGPSAFGVQRPLRLA